MGLHVGFKSEGGLLLANVSGSLSLDESLRLLKQVCDTAAEEQVNKILVNCLSVDGELSTFERYGLGVETAAYFHQHLMTVRLAFVGKPPAMNGFAVLVGRNRGIATELFSTPEDALSWLARQPR